MADPLLDNKILILGSGKMARDLGLAFLRKGARVTWISRSADRLEALQTFVLKRIRRFKKLEPDLPYTAAFSLPEGPLAAPPDLVI